MSRVFGMIFCSMMMVLTTGCGLNSINGLLNAAGIDLSEVDFNELLSEFMSGM